MNKKRIIILMHSDLIPPDSIEGLTDEEVLPYKTEFDVTATLREMGHDIQPLGVTSNLERIKDAVDEFNPHIVFNLLEEFHGIGVYDAHVVSFLELLKTPYTGCNPRGLMLAHNKALSKMICRYHRIRVPQFHVFPIYKKVRRPSKLQFPLIVKSLTEEGSVGISQASIVYNDEALAERVDFIHRTLTTDAIAEQYIEGRELYVAVSGNDRLETYPIWELEFKKLREDAPRIATGRIKWDLKYRKQVGIDSSLAKELPENLLTEIPRFCKRAYKALMLSGYARMDLRLTPEGKIYLLEANPNPELAYGEDFAESAEAANISYEKLLTRIINLGLRYRLKGQA
ncbi:Ddl-like protein [Poriferisphaera corsica]|uniref:Ddl-like protein n=1 Tax=Poriferisphaera corsica TaxID=2528020 RepID=A0A517YX89_9BACT|nr:D-alanine--D-alanine ligase [Poriferisphaera corsica]QDU34838.1 Ddl-like protein [Poriferisphaera corsica]